MDASGLVSRRDRSQSVWSEKPEGPASLAGCANLGTDLEAGADYRHACEWSRFRRMVPLAPTWRVAELGAGNGRWLETLAPLVKECVGIDYSRPMLDLAAERLAAASIHNCRLVHGSITSDLLEGKFDLVYFSGCLQYLDDTDAREAVRLAMRHLAPGGWLVDRTTISLLARVQGSREQRYSLYRTLDDHLDLFRGTNLALVARRKSYAWLWLPAILRRSPFDRWTNWCLRTFAPLSHALASAASRLHTRFRPSQHELEYSHDFFVFHEPDARP